MTPKRFGTMIFSVLMSTALVRADAPAATKPDPKTPFYVYATKSLHQIGHYAPSGWMGDTGDLHYEEAHNSPKPDDTCVKIKYSAKGSKGAGWAGIYWQNPNNNWGSRAGGFNLSAFKKLTFMARGEKGGEKISDFKMGGIQGEFGDSDTATTGPVTLTPKWKSYTIDLTGKDLSRVIGGFCFAASRDDNPDGFTIYLNNIRYEP